jgi:hypothetical protein
MTSFGDPMVALRESPARAFRAQAPVGQVLGEPRFRWGAHPTAWLYRVELIDHEGREVARGWSGMHELPLAWLRRPDSGDPPELDVGHTYRWRVYAYEDAPTGEPTAAAPEASFLFLGP